MSSQKIPWLVTGASSEFGRATGFELASRDQPNAANTRFPSPGKRLRAYFPFPGTTTPADGEGTAGSPADGSR